MEDICDFDDVLAGKAVLCLPEVDDGNSAMVLEAEMLSSSMARSKADVVRRGLISRKKPSHPFLRNFQTSTHPEDDDDGGDGESSGSSLSEENDSDHLSDGRSLAQNESGSRLPSLVDHSHTETEPGPPSQAAYRSGRGQGVLSSIAAGAAAAAAAAALERSSSSPAIPRRAAAGTAFPTSDKVKSVEHPVSAAQPSKNQTQQPEKPPVGMRNLPPIKPGRPPPPQPSVARTNMSLDEGLAVGSAHAPLPARQSAAPSPKLPPPPLPPLLPASRSALHLAKGSPLKPPRAKLSNKVLPPAGEELTKESYGGAAGGYGAGDSHHEKFSVGAHGNPRVNTDGKDTEHGMDMTTAEQQPCDAQADGLQPTQTATEEFHGMLPSVATPAESGPHLDFAEAVTHQDGLAAASLPSESAASLAHSDVKPAQRGDIKIREEHSEMVKKSTAWDDVQHACAERHGAEPPGKGSASLLHTSQEHSSTVSRLQAWHTNTDNGKQEATVGEPMACDAVSADTVANSPENGALSTRASVLAKDHNKGAPLLFGTMMAHTHVAERHVPQSHQRQAEDGAPAFVRGSLRASLRNPVTVKETLSAAVDSRQGVFGVRLKKTKLEGDVESQLPMTTASSGSERSSVVPAATLYAPPSADSMSCTATLSEPPPAEHTKQKTFEAAEQPSSMQGVRPVKGSTDATGECQSVMSSPRPGLRLKPAPRLRPQPVGSGAVDNDSTCHAAAASMMQGDHVDIIERASVRGASTAITADLGDGVFSACSAQPSADSSCANAAVSGKDQPASDITPTDGDIDASSHSKQYVATGLQKCKDLQKAARSDGHDCTDASEQPVVSIRLRRKSPPLAEGAGNVSSSPLTPRLQQVQRRHTHAAYDVAGSNQSSGKPVWVRMAAERSRRNSIIIEPGSSAPTAPAPAAAEADGDLRASSSISRNGASEAAAAAHSVSIAPNSAHLASSKTTPEQAPTMPRGVTATASNARMTPAPARSTNVVHTDLFTSEGTPADIAAGRVPKDSSTSAAHHNNNNKPLVPPKVGSSQSNLIKNTGGSTVSLSEGQLHISGTAATGPQPLGIWRTSAETLASAEAGNQQLPSPASVVPNGDQSGVKIRTGRPINSVRDGLYRSTIGSESSILPSGKEVSNQSGLTVSNEKSRQVRKAKDDSNIDGEEPEFVRLSRARIARLRQSGIYGDESWQ